MSRCKLFAALALGLALGLVWAERGWSQDGPPGPPQKPEAWDGERGPGARGEFPPPKPPLDMDSRGPRPGDERGWQQGPPRGDDRRGPPRDGDRRGPMPKEGREGRLPPGPPPGDLPGGPRWPHEDWRSMEQNDPEMFKLLREDMELERQTREMAMQFRRAPKEEREKIKAHVQEIVTKHFDVRQKRRQMELKRLEDELKRLQNAMEKREKSRQDLINRRVNDLVGSEESAF
jgi:hypothetical protein